MFGVDACCERQKELGLQSEQYVMENANCLTPSKTLKLSQFVALVQVHACCERLSRLTVCRPSFLPLFIIFVTDLPNPAALHEADEVLYAAGLCPFCLFERQRISQRGCQIHSPGCRTGLMTICIRFTYIYIYSSLRSHPTGLCTLVFTDFMLKEAVHVFLLMKKLMTAGAKVNITAGGATPLHIAVGWG
ncbi:hypothetical protein L6164_010606 [Bauhinia variegata]|uniref:Uncharacterized protein n=1 Tax=Bauhinia variegata TaxID=167791 RepID=A0ACB9PNC9_BAUVA|nr:hypothetical protein L6164_010606 [Bauhinia variegata]